MGIADKWAVDISSKAIGDGLVLGDGKKHPISIIYRDTQSDSNRAAQVAGDLINNEKVDLLTASSGPDNVDPAADAAEAMETPFICVTSPWAPFVFARGGSPDKPFKWTYGFLLGIEQMTLNMIDIFGKTPTNKKVAFLLPNSADGIAWADTKTGAPAFLESAGYSVVVPQLYTPGSEDFTAQISEFKKAGCEILGGANTAPDFTNFWKQSLQQGFKPPVASMGLAVGFPQVAESIGPSVYGLIDPGCAWHKAYPYKDSLTGMTGQELAADYEKATDGEWTGAIGIQCKFSWAVDVLQRATNLDDKETILDAIKSTNLVTLQGPIDMTKPVDKNPFDPKGTRPHPNVVKVVVTGVQWQKGSKWPYEQAGHL